MRPLTLAIVVASTLGATCGRSDGDGADDGASSAAIAQPLLDGGWRLYALGANDRPEAIPASVEITLEIDGEGLRGSAGCNGYGGTATIDATGGWASGPIHVTRMACPEPAMGFEIQYLEILTAADAYETTDDELTLHDTAGRRVLIFTRPETCC